MSVTYPADATATTYLFTLRGKVNTPTVADARELHNKTAGSADGIAAARALGDLSHNVYTSAGNGAGSDEVLIIDYWNSPAGSVSSSPIPKSRPARSFCSPSEKESSGPQPAASATFISRCPPAHRRPLSACSAPE